MVSLINDVKDWLEEIWDELAADHEQSFSPNDFRLRKAEKFDKYSKMIVEHVREVLDQQAEDRKYESKI